MWRIVRVFHNRREWLLSGAVLIACVLACTVALAAAPAPFGDIGTKLWSIGEALVQLGRGGMLVGGAWAILAAIGRIGYFSAAVSVFAGGLFLANLTTLVEYLIPQH